ncbi:MAG: hypothetical protein QG670_1317 [Thermoproteota archaeon]|nr:hypothetical protein [Thermoproteota archaeon]
MKKGSDDPIAKATKLITVNNALSKAEAVMKADKKMGIAHGAAIIA